MTCCHLSGSSLILIAYNSVDIYVKRFSTSFRTWSSLEKFVPIKEFCSDLNDDNWKAQGQVSMVGEVGQTSQAPTNFSCVTLAV